MKRVSLIRQLVVCLTLGLLLFLAGNTYALDGGTLGSADAQFIGDSAGDRAGYRAVAGAGDVNGDGFDDLIVGAYRDGEAGYRAGAAYLVLGGAGGWGLDTSLAHPSVIKFYGENPGDNAGYSVAGAGDVDGDGYDDLLIGAPAYIGGANRGAAYLVLGSDNLSGGSLGTVGVRYTGEASWDRAGYSVAGAGDVNGDGFDDMLVGAWGYSDRGAAYLVLGSDSLSGGGLGASGVRYTGENADDNAGRSVAGAGDVDGDGYDDLLIGAPGHSSGNDTGAAYLVLGSGSPSSGGLAPGMGIYRYTGQAPDDAAGTWVAGAGDANGDGFADMLVGAPGNDAVGSDAGAAYLVLGSDSPSSRGLAPGLGIYRYTGEASGNNYAGTSVSGAGDVNGDGYADMLVGASGNDAVGSDAGAAYLVLGSGSPSSGGLAPGSGIYRYTGEAVGDNAGIAVSGAGDVNGDGYADMLVGAYRYDDGGADDAGAAYLLLSDFLTPGDRPMRQRHRLQSGSDAPSVAFDQAGVLVNFEDGALSPGEIVVERYFYHPCDNSMWLQMPIWNIRSNKIDTNDTGPGSTIEIWFEYTDDQIAGMVEQNLAVWYRPDDHNCREWTRVTDAFSVDYLFVDQDWNRVRVRMTGVKGLSQFTLAESEPSPTAVRAVSMGTHLAQEPVWLVVLLAMLVLTSGATYWYLRRQEERTLVAPRVPDVTDVIASKVATLLRNPPEE